ncbi:MAG: OmpA family protein [Verrucomicrobiota bacterium]
MARFSIPNEVGATVFAILSGLSAIFLTAWAFGPGGCANHEGKKITPVPLAGGISEEEFAAANARAEEEAARRAELAAALQKSRSEIEYLSNVNGGLLDRIATLEKETAGQEELLAKKSAQLAAAKESSASTKAALRTKVSGLQRQLDTALYGDQLKPAADFPPLDLPFLVNNPIDLNQAVRPLFIRLREFKGGPDEMEKIYGELTEDGKTEALHQVLFESGSAEIGGEESGKLSELVADSSKAAKFLVVGYASVDGDAKANYELSSKRASAVATAIAAASKLGESAIQAVYFGQTKRFSETEMPPNRVVEVWRVK